MLNLRQLEIFRAVLYAGSFTGASERLQMSQPAVTKAIRRMEDQLGFRLFDRVKGRISATPEARSLQIEVEKVFHSVRVVENYAVDLRDARTGVVSIACTPTMSYGFLSRAIAEFRAERPRVRIWLQVTTTRDAIELAASGQVDIGLIYAPASDEGVDVLPLFETDVVCVMQASHPLARRDTVKASHLASESIITNVRNQPLHDLIDLAFRGLELDRTVMIGTNSTISACAMVRAGCGIAVVEPLGLSDIFPDLVLRPLSPRVTLIPRAITMKSKALSGVARRFLSILTAVAQADQAHPPAAIA